MTGVMDAGSRLAAAEVSSATRTAGIRLLLDCWQAPPAQCEAAGRERAQAAAQGDDRGGGYNLGSGAGQHEGGALADDQPHVGQAEGLGAALARHPFDERDVRSELVDGERARKREDRQ